MKKCFKFSLLHMFYASFGSGGLIWHEPCVANTVPPGLPNEVDLVAHSLVICREPKK